MSSVIRRFLLWWFDVPFSPWVCGNIVIDVTETKCFLERINQEQDIHITLQHIIAKAVTHALQKVPEANARIIGNKIATIPNIGIAMPVNLIGHQGGQKNEISMILLREAQSKTILQIAQETQTQKSHEQKGNVQSSFVRNLMKFAEKTPDRLTRKILNGLDALSKNPQTSQKIFDLFPATTAITNPGSNHPRDIEGIAFRGGSFHPPLRIAHVGTFWAITGIQKEVLPINGKPEVREVLPVMLTFDHRLIDGFKASKLLLAFSEVLKKPQDHIYLGAPEGNKY
jgi:pyruvate/2-oxoglutarate dehydrogenase complex dihydrolipoamide acyltransferase (E2) component